MRCCPTSTRRAWAVACSSSCSDRGRVVIKDYYAELPIELKVSGRFHDIGAFAADVANLSRIVTLHNLSIAEARAAVMCCRWKQRREPTGTSMPRKCKTCARPLRARRPSPRQEPRNDRPLRSFLSMMAAGLVVLLLAACSAEQQELAQWMDQQRKEVKPNVQPILAAEEVQSAAVSGCRCGRAVQFAKAHRGHQAGSATAEFAAGV